MAHTIESGTSIPADRLRDALGTVERRVVTVDADTVENLLLQLDQTQQLFVDVAQDHVDLRPEEVRWRSLMGRITSKPGPIVRAAAKAGGLGQLRAKHPPAEGVWWHLDSLIAERRRRSAVRTGATILIVVGILGALYWGINTLFPPDPDAVLMVDTTADVDRLAREERWVEALAVIDRTLEQLPDEPELWIWKAVLLERLEEPQSAEEARALARELLSDTPTMFWILLGNTRFQVGDIEGAEHAATQAVDSSPADPQGYFLLGTVAEMMGDIPRAVEMFDKTYELAEGTNPELQVIARVRLGQMLQSPRLPNATATPIPDAASSP